MAYIQKRVLPNGKISYRARIRISGSRDRSATFATRKEAKCWAVRKEAEIRAGRYFEREESKEHTFEEFIDRYLEKELPKNPKSLVKVRTQLLWWRENLRGYYLCHVSPPMISALKERLLSEMTPRKALRTPSTTNRYLAALSKALSVAVKDWGWLKENPAGKVTRLRENKPRGTYLDRDEISHLLTECKKSKSPHLYAVTLMALATGARKGEILSLKWADIDFKRAIAILRDTKNGETRSLPLSPLLVKCLIGKREKSTVCSEYVFPDKCGNRPADIRTAWDRVVKITGLSICFHSLRHTAASHLAMRGVSTLELGLILGHKCSASILRYSHFSTSTTAGGLANKG